MFPTFNNFLILIFATILRYTATDAWAIVTFTVIFILAAINLFYGFFRLDRVEDKINNFLKDNGWNHKQQVQDFNRLLFESSQGNTDSFFVFLVNYQVESFRKSEMTFKRLSIEYSAYYNHDVCIIYNESNNTASLYRHFK